MTVHAKFDGTGRFDDPDPATKLDEPIDAGVPFETTQKRLDELLAQGIPVSKVSQAEATKQAPSGANKEA